MVAGKWRFRRNIAYLVNAAEGTLTDGADELEVIGGHLCVLLHRSLGDNVVSIVIFVVLSIITLGKHGTTPRRAHTSLEFLLPIGSI